MRGSSEQQMLVFVMLYLAFIVAAVAWGWLA